MKGAFIFMQQLIRQAKKGDDEALRELFSHYRPLVYSIRNKYFLRDFDDQDWLQEGLITFHDCLQSFEPGFGTTLGAFFKRAFENRIRSFVRKECAYKRKSNQQTVSYEQKFLQEGNELAPDYSMSVNPLDHILVQETLEECQDLLSELEKEAFAVYVLGNHASITSERALRSAYDRSKRKITQHLRKLKTD
jgi:RNA polymerase sporulation-specific sigma factor